MSTTTTTTWWCSTVRFGVFLSIRFELTLFGYRLVSSNFVVRQMHMRTTSKMSAPRQNCLVILSAANEGVTAQSFAQAYNIANSNFQLQLASPNGRSVEFVGLDDSNRRWFNEFRAKSNSNPIGLETIDPGRYSALLLPDSPGAMYDLVTNQDLKQILCHFVKEKKAICAIGMGVTALCCAKQDDTGLWCFEDYSLTTVSLYELARTPDFPSLPVIPEDYIKDHGAKYSWEEEEERDLVIDRDSGPSSETGSGEPDSVHVVIDRHVITGQNMQSTIMAVQNLILMCTQKSGRLSPRH